MKESRLVEEILQSAPCPLNHHEIWKIAVEKGFDKRADWQSDNPAEAVDYYLRYKINADADAPQYGKTTDKPIRYYLESRKGELDFTRTNNTTVAEGDNAKYQECDLHPLLAYCAHANAQFSGKRKIYTKTIDHLQSTSKGYSEWGHPDMVGVYFPFDDLSNNVVKLSHAFNSNEIFQLFSFELKREITRSNYRESFFQAVSNSSWANEGYLVAAEIAEDEELRRELGRLSNAFGIGIIRLDVRDICASPVLFRATQRSRVDLDFINKLCQNADFNNFIDRVNTDIGAGQIHLSEYDEIKPDINAYIREKFGIETVE